MFLDPVFLSRVQFGINISFHYLFPPMTIGLSYFLIALLIAYIFSKNEMYGRLFFFWSRIFAIFFVMGVATGFVQLFSFGANWSRFSRFVGDIFGPIFVSEALLAFFLEGIFIGIMIFGWKKVNKWIHLLATCFVSLGATLSAAWIVMANSWMQTPDGFEVIGEGIHKRVIITDIWKVYFNPSFFTRLFHVLFGCAMLASFFFLAVGAFYVLKKRHVDFGKTCVRWGGFSSLFLVFAQLISADMSCRNVAFHQPLKLAAMEATFETRPYSSFVLIGYIDVDKERVYGISIPGLLSLLTYRDPSVPVQGLKDFDRSLWPWVSGIYYSYRLMMYSWGMMTLIAMLVVFFLWRRSLYRKKWLLMLVVISPILPYIANTMGWFTAEAGRQPWTVYNVLRTSESYSHNLSGAQVFTSLITLVIFFSLLISIFTYILFKKISDGPRD